MAAKQNIYLWDGGAWVEALGDGLGHFQVDIMSMPIPESRIFGYDGAAWHRLLTESNLLHNLRVKLYDGANGINADLLSLGDIPNTQRGLDVNACLRVYYPAGNAWRDVQNVYTLGDANTGSRMIPVGRWGYNGASWDRVRSYPGGIQKVGRAEVGLSTLRRTDAGQVKASAGKLYWMTMNPSAANSVIELTDDTDGLGAIVWDMTHGANSAHHMNIDPPMEFANGIYLKTLTNFTSVIFGYL